MSGNNITLGIRLAIDGKEVTGGVTVAREDFRKLAIDARHAGEATAGGMTTAAKGVRSLSEQLVSARNYLVSYLGATQMAAAAKWAVDQASAMQQLEARLRVATAGAAEFARAQAGVFEIANRWGAAVSETAGAFARLNPVIAQLGGSSAVTLKMLDGLGASLRLSGATAQETGAILTQFAQAMGSGRVGGDEFRSMMESAEPLMRAVAVELGKTTGELRQMAEEGGLTSSVFGNALLPAIDKLVAQAGGIPQSIGQAWQALRNNLTRDFGREFAEQSNAIGEAIASAAGHTGELAAGAHAIGDALAEMGRAAAVVGAAGLAGVLARQAQAAIAFVAAYQEALRAAVLKAEADLVAARSASVATAATLAEAQAQQRLAAQVALYGAQRAAVEREVSAALAAHAGAAAMAEAAERRLAIAATEAGVAAQAKALATRSASAAAQVAGTAVAALGGPIGVVTALLTAGATAWMLWGNSGKQAAADTAGEVARALDQLANKRLVDATGNSFAPLIEKDRAEIDALREARSQYWQDNNTDLAEVKKTLAEMDADISARSANLKRLESDSAAAAASASQARLSAAGEYAKLTESLKWREKTVAEYNTKLLNLQQAFADKMAATTSEGARADLLRNHQAALAAMLAERQQALESLPGAKEGQAALKARLDGEIALEKAAADLRLDLLKLSHEAGLIDEQQHSQAVLAETRKRLQAQYAVYQEQYDAAKTAAEREQALTKMRETAIEMARAEAKAETDLAVATKKAYEERSKAAADWVKAATDEADATKKTNLQIQEQIDTLGMSARELAEYKARKLDAAAATGEFAARELEAAAQLLEEQRVLPEVAAGYRQLAAAKRAAAGQVADQADLTRSLGERQERQEFVKEWEKSWEEVDRLSRQAFADMVHGGRDAAERIGDAVKSALLSAIYEATLRPIVFQVYANVAGALGVPVSSTMPGGSGGLGGASNLFSLGNNIFGNGTSLYNSFSLSSTGASLGLSAPLFAETYGMSAMASAPALAELGIGTYGMSLAPAAGSAAALTSTGAALGTAMPYVAAAVAALALFGGDLFGDEEATPEMGFTQYRRGTTWGDRYGERVDAADPIYRETPFGILRLAGQHLDSIGGDGVMAQLAEKYLEPIRQLDTALAAYMSEGEVSAVSEALSGWMPGEGENEALFAQQLKNRLDLITDEIGGWVDSLADTATGSLEAMYGQITAILSVREREGAQSIAEALLGGASEFQREGETLAATFVRLVAALDVVNGAFADLGYTALDASLASADLASNLIKAFGGADAFNSSVAAYYSEFYSEEEKLANLTRRATERLAEFNLELPANHQGVRDLASSLLQMGESGQAALAALIGLSPALDQIYDAAEAAATATAAGRTEWQNKLDILTGRVTQRQLDWQRDLASTTDTTTQALINQYYAQLALTDATQAATERAEYIAQIVADQRDGAGENLTAAQDDLRRAYDEEYAAKQKIIDQFGDYLASLRDYRNQLLTGDLSPLDPMARTAEAERQYQDIKRLAAIGNTDAIERLQGTSQSYLQNMLASYGRNSAEYAAAFYDVQDTLAATESLAERQIAIANDSLDELRAQTAGLLTLNDSVLSIADAIANLRIAQQNVTALGGSGGGSPSGGVSFSPAQSVAEQWFSTYATSFSPSSETLSWWNDKIASVGAERALAQFLNPNPSAPRLDALLSDPDYAAYVLGIPGYAEGGTPRGLFAAGEGGRTELVYSPSPVRVLSSNDSRAAVIDGGEVSALLKRAVELLAKVVDGQHADQSQRGAAATATIAELSELSEKVDAQRRALRTKAAA